MTFAWPCQQRGQRAAGWPRWWNLQDMSRAAQSKLLALVMHACQHSGRFDSVCDEEKDRRQSSRIGKDKKAGAAMPFITRARPLEISSLELLMPQPASKRSRP